MCPGRLNRDGHAHVGPRRSLVAARAPPVLVQYLDQLELQAHQSSGVAPVNLDVCIFQLNMVRSNITASLFPGAPS